MEKFKAKLIATVTSPASLVAATDDELPSFSISKLGTFFDSAIWHGGLPDQVSTTTDGRFPSNSISEVSISQNGVRKTTDVSSTKPSTSGIDVIQVSSPQIGFSQIRPMQVSGMQISIPNNSAFQTSFDQDSTSQIGTSQISISQIGSAQVDLCQIKFSEVDWIPFNFPLGLDQINSPKISLPISISKPQLFSRNFPSHTLTPELISTINNIALTLWNTLFAPQTPLRSTFDSPPPYLKDNYTKTQQPEIFRTITV